ncbi:MAG: FkbM family methyltransferase [Alphaproteobacteria bacterium]
MTLAPEHSAPAAAAGNAPARIELAVAADGTALLPAAFRDRAGRPRFHLPLARAFEGDPAIQVMARHELAWGGFEHPLRAFLDAHLAPGDTLIDVGAHWGLIALHAATRHRGAVRVLAVEPHPDNLAALRRAVAENGLDGSIAVVAAAAAEAGGDGALALDSTMAHRLSPRGSLPVRVTTLDALAAEHATGTGRVFLKIDVEGAEGRVLSGARRLLASGRVAAVVWEQGRAFGGGDGRAAARDIVAFLARHGFTCHVLPRDDIGGALLPWHDAIAMANVYALAPGFPRQPAYARPHGPLPPPLPPLPRLPGDPGAAERTAALIAARSADGARWSAPADLHDGADARAAAAARHVAPGARALDLGAGLGRLRAALPESCRWRPVDLAPLLPRAIVLDLERQFPALAADVVAALALVAHIHDPARLLALAAGAAPRLLVTYPCHAGGATDARRAAGIVNDHDDAGFRALLDAAFWRVEATEDIGAETLFVCARRS